MEKIAPKILFIDNESDHNLYQPLEHWRPLFIHPFEVFHAPYDKVPDLELFSHIFLSGSLASTLENKDWMLSEEELIRKAVEQKKAILGNCFGHQLLARALFGHEAVRKRNKPEIGWPTMRILRDDLLLGIEGDLIHGFVLHFDDVQYIDEDQADIILNSEECDNLAFKLKNKPVWGIQPHFEIGIVQGFGVIDIVSGPGVPDKKLFLSPGKKSPRDSGIITRVMREFQRL